VNHPPEVVVFFYRQNHRASLPHQPVRITDFFWIVKVFCPRRTHFQPKALHWRLPGNRQKPLKRRSLRHFQNPICRGQPKYPLSPSANQYTTLAQPHGSTRAIPFEPSRWDESVTALRFIAPLPGPPVEPNPRNPKNVNRSDSLFRANRASARLLGSIPRRDHD
jgi:hypothetical protein